MAVERRGQGGGQLPPPIFCQPKNKEFKYNDM